MLVNNSVIAIYGNHTEAEEAVKELEKSGFDMKKISIVGKDYQSEEHVIGYYNTGEHVGYWGKSGTFWGAICGFLFGSALIFIPGVGPIFVAGPLVGALIGALEGAVITGKLSPLGSALYSIGIPEDSIIKYETYLKSDKFLLIVYDTVEEVKRAHEILKTTKVEEIVSYKIEGIQMVTFTLEEGKLVCSFSEKLNTNICTQIESEVTAKVSEARCPVVFNLHGIDYITSSFLRICIHVSKLVGSVNFSIINVSPHVKKVFEVAGFYKLLDIT